MDPKILTVRTISGLLLSLAAVYASADAYVHVPSTSMVEARLVGIASHTNHLIYDGPDLRLEGLPIMALTVPLHGPSASAPAGFNPEQIRAAYGVTAEGKGVIAIVDAYHYATSLNDFNVFSTEFGLPLETSTSVTASTNKVFQVVYANGKQPKADAGWGEEEALDIEWAHAIAPSAKIVLVEAATSNNNDLYAAVDKAASLSGVTQISMSWGGSEFNGEKSEDVHFSKTGITFFAASGDTGGQVIYPAASPNVVGVGGTTLRLATGGGYGNEIGWSDSGGGLSAIEAKPAFQSSVTKVVKYRGTPDIAFDADPNTGCAVYDSTAYEGYKGWMVFGGTSLATPIAAAVANVGAKTEGQNENTYIYSHSSLFNDVTSGRAGKQVAGTGYDFVTGWGSAKTQASL